MRMLLASVALFITGAALFVASLVGNAGATTAPTSHPSLVEIVRPNGHIVLFDETGLNLAYDVVCHSSTNKIGAPFEMLRCTQFTK